MAALDVTHARDVLRASDPDLGRLRMGVRALLAAVGATVVLTVLARAAHVPAVLGFLGINVAVLGALMVNDLDRHAQRITQLLVPIAASAATLLGTALAPYPLLSSLVFLAVIYAAVAVRRYGPRGVALGMVAFIAYFMALFFRVPLSAMPLCIAGILVAGAIAYLVRFVLVVDRPRAIANSLRTTLLRSVALAVGPLERGDAGEKRISRAIRRVNNVALVLDEHLDAPAARAIAERSVDDVRGAAFEVEVGIERFASALSWLPARPPQLLASLARVRRFVRDGGDDPEAIEAEVAATIEPEGRARQRVQSSLHDLLAGVVALRAARLDPAEEPRVTAPVDAAALTEPGMHLATRQAIQATIAGGLAMIAGTLISTTRWYWAVIAAFVMFTRTTTRGETVVRGVERIVGTAIGVVGGVWLGSWFTGHSTIELAIVFVCVFVAYYFLQAAYAGMVLAITLLLSALYGLLGRFSPGILYLRLAETIAGCVIGAIVAIVVLPSSTSAKLRSTLRDVLRDLAALLENRFAPHAVPQRDRARQLDRKLRDLRVASRPLVGPLMRAGSSQPAELVHLASTAWYFARHLSARAGVGLPEEARSALESLARRIAADARAVADGARIEDAHDAIEHARETIAAAGQIGGGPASPRAALDWLSRVDGALLELGVLLADQRRAASHASISSRRLRSA